MAFLVPALIVASILIVPNMVSSLDPNEYGIIRNYISGNLGYQVERGGLYFTGPIQGFLTFPATQVTLEFSASDLADRTAIQTRTGADPRDPDSGGQPISISCAIQFQFVPESLRDVYLAFGSYQAAKQRYILLAGNMVSNIAQEFTPQDFWNRRDDIAVRMLSAVNRTLWSQGKVVAVRFEVMKVDFADKFEESITAVQVAEQQKVVNEYEQQVQQVVQMIEVMRSENMATIASISAGADRKYKEICADAKRDAFNLKQGMKAQKYAELQSKLGFDRKQMAEYFKVKSVQEQGGGGKVVIGLPGIGEAQASPAPPTSPAAARPRRRLASQASSPEDTEYSGHDFSL